MSTGDHQTIENSCQPLGEKPVTEVPIIGVAIPAHNAAKFLGRALQSVAAQQHLPTHIVVVDDGSTDSTHEIVEAFAAELAIQHQQISPILGANASSTKEPTEIRDVRCIRTLNAGAGAARNLAVAHLNTELVAFLDADDEWHPQWLTHIARQSTRTKEDLMFGTLTNQVQPNLIASDYRCPPQTDAPQTSCSVVRRSAFTRFGVFADDSYSWVTWLARARIQGLTEVRLHNNNGEHVGAGTRWITGENITLRQDASSHYLQTVRTLINYRRTTSNPIPQQNS